MNQPAAVRVPNQITNFPVDHAWLALAEKEQILEPELAIVDAHHHIFDRPEGRYLVPDLESDLAQGHNVVATVFVEGGNFFYRRGGPDVARPVGETEIVVSMTATQKNVCNGIVGYADLFAGAAVGDVLDQHIALGRGRFAGIRQFAMWDESDDIKYYAHPPQRPLSAGMLLDGKFREGFAQLAPRKLVFDCSTYHAQLPDVIDLAKSFPDTVIVLDHLGCVARVGPYAERDDEVFAFWKSHLKTLAEHRNVVLKIGGLGMRMYGFDFRSRAKPPRSSELAELWRPFIETGIEIFGARRAMFESNFPVDKGYFTFAACWNAFKRVTAQASAADKRALYSGTAIEAYRLKIEA